MHLLSEKEKEKNMLSFLTSQLCLLLEVLIGWNFLKARRQGIVGNTIFCNVEQAGKGLVGIWDQIGWWPKHWIVAVFCSVKHLLKNTCIQIKRVHEFICEFIVLLLQIEYYLEIPEDCTMPLMIVHDAKPLIVRSFYGT